MGKLKRQTYYGFQIVAVGAVTGAFVGVIVTLYGAFAALLEEFSRGYYGFFRDRPAFIPLLFVALFLGAVVVGGLLRFFPMIKGSGIPQTEGAARGLLRFRWYETLTAMFAASLLTIFLGMSGGSEGPSILIGGSTGYGVSATLRRNAIVRRYQITGGACAGLAVALNAPLTGMAFAFEEAHKRFTPEVFVCAFSSVVIALVIRTVLRPALGLSVGDVIPTFFFPDDTGLLFCAYAFGAAVAVSLVGMLFYALVFAAQRLLERVRFWKGTGRLLPAFLLAGAAGLLTPYVMGGGRFFLDALGSGSEGIEPLFSSPVWATILVVVLLKLLLTVLNMGAGVPCGAFIPMLAIGAGLGALMNFACLELGMDPALSDALILVSMAAFFTSVTKAPITGIVMILELTWKFTFLLPVVVSVATGYLVSEVFRTEPIYDKLLERLLKEKRAPAQPLTVRVRVGERASGRQVRDILWPFTALAVSLRRGEETLVPKGSTELRLGDVLTVQGAPDDRAEYLADLTSEVGEVLTEERPPSK